MIACYDLGRCPPTYDVVAFLALTERERLRRGDEVIDLHILPGPAGGFRGCDSWPPRLEERVQLRENVLVPLCDLLPSVRRLRVDGDRSADGWGKGEYLVGLPRILEALRAGVRPLRAPSLGRTRHPHLITLTLREADHWPLRNSKVREWIRAAEDLARSGWEVVIVPDTARSSAELEVDGVRVDCEAAVSLSKRAALYSWAALNVGISNGPMWMSIFMDAPTLMLRPATNEAGGCYDYAFHAKCGLPRGSQLPTSPPHQRLVWEDDTCENIVRAVEDMTKTEAHTCPAG